MYVKDFLSWTKVKERINSEERNIVIRPGEIRWAALGVNVGSEMDGKGINYARPVLIIHCFSSSLCLAVPLTSKSKTVPGYETFEWGNHKDSICIMQMRMISSKRILRRIGKVSDKKVKEIKDKIKLFYKF